MQYSTDTLVNRLKMLLGTLLVIKSAYDRDIFLLVTLLFRRKFRERGSEFNCWQRARNADSLPAITLYVCRKKKKHVENVNCNICDLKNRDEKLKIINTDVSIFQAHLLIALPHHTPGQHVAGKSGS